MSEAADLQLTPVMRIQRVVSVALLPCCRAVDLALSVGIFPYVLKLLQTISVDLRPTLVFIWCKILALDLSCQVFIATSTSLLRYPCSAEIVAPCALLLHMLIFLPYLDSLCFPFLILLLSCCACMPAGPGAVCIWKPAGHPPEVAALHVPTSGACLLFFFHNMTMAC
eukprot:1157234-Pelagomonas_calceolata.AAC.20